MGEVSVRKLGPADIATIRAVWSEAGLHVAPQGRDSEEHIAQEMAQGSAHFLGAFVDGEMAGVVLATHDGRKGWVNRLAVRPKNRQGGIAKALVSASEELFKGLGLGLSCALIEDWNDPSLKLFEKEGYVFRKDIFYYRKNLGKTDW
jgi:N-acetylglutamate synthase